MKNLYDITLKNLKYSFSFTRTNNQLEIIKFYVRVSITIGVDV